MTIGSLFSGIGGLERGLELCGHGPVLWQAECDPYARGVLERHWPGVRRYDDVRQVDGKAKRVSIICGGFPCQPASTAGPRKAQRDTRWLWPHFAAVVARLAPRFVFIENVPGLRQAGLRDVLVDLAALGFDAEWDLFTAAAAGAPHRRNRLFLLAYSPGQRVEAGAESSVQARVHVAGGRGGADDPWPAEPDVGRVAHGVPARVDRLRCLGNAVVPQQAALAWRALSERIVA